MYFTFDYHGGGTWEAESALCVDIIHAVYRIIVCDDGSFDVNQSDGELLPLHKLPTFPTLAMAQAWCEEAERTNGKKTDEFPVVQEGSAPRLILVRENPAVPRIAPRVGSIAGNTAMNIHKECRCVTISPSRRSFLYCKFSR